MSNKMWFVLWFKAAAPVAVDVADATAALVCNLVLS